MGLTRRIQRHGNISSKLFDQETFYQAFLKDIRQCRKQLIIESPFLTKRRTRQLLPQIKKAVQRGAHVIVNTKPLAEHDEYFCGQAKGSIYLLQGIDVEILFTGGHHRKLAIIDGTVLWEGSLNILSQNDSCELMRRTDSYQLANEMISFTRIKHYLF